MLKQAEVIEKLQEAIKEIFNSTGTVKATRTGFAGTRLLNQEIKPDLVIQAETKEKEKYLIVLEVKSTGQPRYARTAAYQLQSIRANRENVYDVFGATLLNSFTYFSLSEIPSTLPFKTVTVSVTANKSKA
jgi:hypothetical protein